MGGWREVKLQRTVDFQVDIKPDVFKRYLKGILSLGVFGILSATVKNDLYIFIRLNLKKKNKKKPLECSSLKVPSHLNSESQKRLLGNVLLFFDAVCAHPHAHTDHFPHCWNSCCLCLQCCIIFVCFGFFVWMVQTKPELHSTGWKDFSSPVSMHTHNTNDASGL